MNGGIRHEIDQLLEYFEVLQNSFPNILTLVQ